MNKQKTLKSRQTRALCLLAVLAYLQAGCAGFSQREDSSEPESKPTMATEIAKEVFASEDPGPSMAAPAGLVARDFVSVLQQLLKVSPQTSTIYLPGDKAADDFVLLMAEELMLAGYAVYRADTVAAKPMLRYTRSTAIVNDVTRKYQYDLKVGDVELRRAYSVDNRGSIRPASNMFIRGVDASAVVLDENVFHEQPVRAKPMDIQERPIAAKPMDLPDASVSRLPANANPLPEIFSSPPTPATLTTRRQLSVNHNIFDTGVSRFDQHLPAQRVVAEEVLIFQNDSLRIGSINKKLIGRMVDMFEPHSDRFSVIGCSMGPTSLKGGNAALALGRANRVVEALMFSGVDRTRIVDEGCWSGDSKRNGLPSRGVVLALKREDRTVNQSW